MMIAWLVAVACAAGCGKSGENGTCSTDTDCEDGLRCALLQGGDGAKHEMCVNPGGAWDLSAAPKSAGLRRYAIPAGVAGGVSLVLVLLLRGSVRARERRKRAKRDA